MPSGADSVQLSASATSSNVAIDANSAVVRVVNFGPNTAYIQFGNAGVVSTAAKMPIPSGATELFTKGQLANVAAICDTGNTALLSFTPGEGI